MSEPTPASQTGGVERPHVRFGIFDWIDERLGDDLAALYDGRLQLLDYADTAGFYCYHLAEHHWTPLCTAPSPSLFLAAAAQRTHNIRLGPLVYLLPLYNPLRLLEEICMLDHLTHGRLEVGIGRGASPYELAPFHVAIDDARDMFNEALAILVQGLTTGEVSFLGKHYSFDNVRAVLRPRQQPYPPLWYPTNYSRSVAWIGEHNFSTVFGSLFPSLEATREQFQLYNAQRAAHAGEAGRLNGHVADPCYGLVRHVYVAETDAQAIAEARAAYEAFQESFAYLWLIHHDERLTQRGDWESFCAQGGIYVGAPATVRAQLQHAMDGTGSNYFAGAFAFGSLTPEQSLRSLNLFVDHVMPAFR
jgi:alkanesulfonate monooxygenase SsuD/methylene tetrahydromethanopterin reductase-like flavin-dependent oxidoreductase (luciferase family)